MNMLHFVKLDGFFIERDVDVILYTIGFTIIGIIYTYWTIAAYGRHLLLLAASAYIQMIAGIAILTGGAQHNVPLISTALPIGIFATWLLQLTLVHLWIQSSYHGTTHPRLHHVGIMAFILLSMANCLLITEFAVIYAHELVLNRKRSALLFILYRIGYGVRLAMCVLLASLSMGQLFLAYGRWKTLHSCQYRRSVGILVAALLLTSIADIFTLCSNYSASTITVLLALSVAASNREMVSSLSFDDKTLVDGLDR
ncbi:hypothetical protein BDF22DRAFT_773819 [Syncephalis plumigaleata]|nr:hypothetical protein BDF22DRAFT_773819 [Syncephalis plumigaleata]